MFDWIGDLFTKIWHAVKRILPYILIACAIWLSMGLAIPLFAGLVIEGTVMNALLFLGASFLLVPEETVLAIEPAIEAIGDVAQEAAKETGQVASDLLSSFSDALGVPSFLIIGGLVFGAYLLLKNKKEDTPTNEKKGTAAAKRIGSQEEVTKPSEDSGSSVVALGATVGGLNA